MAPTKPRNKHGRSKAAKLKRQTASAAPRTRTARQLLAEATGSLEQGELNRAAAAATEALEVVSGEDVEDSNAATSIRRQQMSAALSLLGEIHLEMGDPDQARGFFLRAAKEDADSGNGTGQDREDEDKDEVLSGGRNRAEKFFWLAQLSEDGGADSVRWYERGAAELRTQLARLERRAGAATTTTISAAASAAAQAQAQAPGQRQAELLEAARQDRAERLASALCAVAEVYMTDLSWEADAEQRCEALVTEATMLAPDSAEAWQTVANVRISQGRVEDACAALRRSIESWSDLDPADPRIPSFATRVSLVRLLMEVEQEDKAVEMAERLVREDDESVEVLYLGGFGQFVLGERLKQAAQSDKPGEAEDWRTLWIAARRWLKQCLALFVAQEYEDDRLGSHAEELLGVLNSELGDVSGDDDDDDWEDADDAQDGGDDGGADEDMDG